MTTPNVPKYPEAGPAQSVKVVTDTLNEGGAAIPVYGFPALPTDGRSIEGAPALNVKVITDADLMINGGRYWIEGCAFALPVCSLAQSGVTPNEGNKAVPVYLVGGSL